jgi:hypothetical protein
VLVERRGQRNRGSRSWHSRLRFLPPWWIAIVLTLLCTGLAAVLLPDVGPPPWLASVLGLAGSLAINALAGLILYWLHRPQPALRPALLPQPERPSPSNLLQAAFGFVEFRGRDAELADLKEWAQTEHRLDVALLVAPGGAGKSRLASQVCLDLEEEGWLVGFLRPSNDSSHALAEVVGNVLVVVDYAETQTEQLVALLDQLGARSRARRGRVLLLARTRGDWWESLKRRVSIDAQELMARTKVFALPPAEPDPPGRREAFHEAARAFASALDGSAAALVEPDFNDQVFNNLLFVHMAALLAVDPGAGLPDRLSEDELLGAVIDREEARYWCPTWEARHLAGDVATRQRTVAIATLTIAASETEAAQALATVPDLTDAQQLILREIARWLSGLYSGPGYLKPLEPDRLGEALVARVCADVPELATELLKGGSDQQQRRTLTVVARAARDYPAATDALQAALARLLDRLLSTAIGVAQATGDPLGHLLADALEQNPAEELVEVTLAQLPEQTVALRELRVVATRAALQRARELAADETRNARVAFLANNLSNWLAELGRRKEALAASEEAVPLYRKLAGDHPDSFNPDLAGSLNNLSNHLANLGRRKDALAPSEEAVALARDLPDSFNPDLAGSLDNLSNRMASLGQRKDALAPSVEAVALYRKLARDLPDSFNPDLAHSLNNLSNRMANFGQLKDALPASDEAVELSRKLASALPDAFNPLLAASLNNRSKRLLERNRRDEAVDASKEAVGLYRELARARADAFNPDLVHSLINFSRHLAMFEQMNKALAASEEAVELSRKLAGNLPDAFNPDLARSLHNLGACLQSLRRWKEALAPNEEALVLSRKLARDFPDAFNPDLAASLNNIAFCLHRLGQGKDALAAGEEAVALYRDLARDLPDVFNHHLAGSLNNLAQIARAQPPQGGAGGD